MIKSRHHLEYCDHCRSWMVVCATCGNNCCNAGYGKVNGETCPDCPEAYEHQDFYHEYEGFGIEFTDDP